ncbi:MAG: hypothetical protein E7302_07365 [Butyrivibrio sp.]|nr:hypothetical protein [Butyrivibrio sp.]
MPEEVTNDILLCSETGSGTMPGIKELTDHILTALDGRENGPWKGIPDEIFIATMGAFSRFVNEHYVSYGNYGFDRYFWTTRQANAKLFRIGELEYELVDEKPGSADIHIPSDASLLPDKLNDSVSKAKTFFSEFFPEKKVERFVLDSWLLSPELKKLLPESSHILHFQAAFDITESNPEPNGFLEWVYKIPGSRLDNVDFESLSEDTSLQRNMKAFLLQGGKIGDACGILSREFM